MNITIPLKEYLDLLIRHNEYAVADCGVVRLIQQIDPQETLCHIEPIEGKDLSRVYHIKDWRESAAHREKLKAKMTVEREKFDARKEKEQSALNRLIAKFGDSKGRSLFTQCLNGDFPQLKEKLGL